MSAAGAIITVLGILVGGGGVVGLLMWRSEVRKANADTAKIAAEGEAVEAKTPVEVESIAVKTLRDALDSLSTENTRLSKRVTHLEEREGELLSERDALKSEISRMSRDLADLQARFAQLSARISDGTD